MLSLAVVLSVFAEPSPTLLQSAMGKYQAAKSITAKIEKSVKTMWGDAQKAKGRLYYARGKMRMELDDDSKTTLIIDGKSLWVILNFEGQLQISQMSSEHLKKGDNVLGAFFGDGKFLKNVEVAKVETNGRIQECLISPKSLKNLEVKSLTVGIRNEELDNISYEDDLGNKTIYFFKSIALNDSIDPTKFQFVPPKGAQVSKF
jgi:outer membrane lipoprotein carrier protein